MNCKWCAWRFGLGAGTVGNSEEEKRPSKWRYCWDRLEYWEESWKPEEICCHSDSSERPSAIAAAKNSPYAQPSTCPWKWHT